MRVLYTGQSATTFVADGLPTWEPDTEMDIPEILAQRILQREDFHLVKDEAQPETSRRSRGSATDAETLSKPDAPAAMVEG